MAQHYLRTFRPFTLEEVKKSLLVIGDLTGNCAACNALGINAYETKACPECGAVFKYIASRRLESHPSERFRLARRLAEKRPDLILIDYQDYQKAAGDKAARDFFSV
ncbi:MAG TPA: hypothetical protein P5561_05685 [Candidatus Omnitrophota bacterium]|nr:hypothetical protein [Candidatus Omnitrophota bacterium]HRY86001.1 hypothetical protein [Candidatus Omnitrophota bacterium]